MQATRDLIESWLGAAWLAPLVVILRVLVIVVLAIVAQRITSRLLRLFRVRFTSGLTAHSDTQRVGTVIRVFRYIATAVITLIAGMLVLSELGISIAPILGAAGVVGLAIGFGAQSLVKDYFVGFFLLLENQIARGDIVQIAGKSGLVEDLTLRYVRLRDYSGDVHYVPNGLITTVTNLTRDFSFALMDIGVAYRENLDEVFAIMRDTALALQADPEFSALILEPLEIAGVESLADSAVIVRCRFKVQTVERWKVRREYLRRLKAAFDAGGIEIPYPHLTIYAGADKKGDATPVQVRMK
ncbi:MAG: mechanosensitive ion channel family protein [Steroidobacteraceae bacterium]